jgi:hypothetical protein
LATLIAPVWSSGLALIQRSPAGAMLGIIVSGFSLQKIKLGHHRKSSPLDLIQRLKAAAVANNSGAAGELSGNHRREE